MISHRTGTDKDSFSINMVSVQEIGTYVPRELTTPNTPKRARPQTKLEDSPRKKRVVVWDDDGMSISNSSSPGASGSQNSDCKHSSACTNNVNHANTPSI